MAGEGNDVALSYRGESFSRIKPRNLELINEFSLDGKVEVLLKSVVKEINNNAVILNLSDENEDIELPNDLVYVFAGGELPTVFLEKIGVRITKKFGEAILKH